MKKNEIMQVKVMKVLSVGKYKESPFLIQRMGNAFQYIVYWEGQFYQSYTIFNPEKGSKDFTHPQEVELAVLINNFMETTIDTLIATKQKIEKEKSKKTNGKNK